jgi:hypothetical protein
VPRRWYRRLGCRIQGRSGESLLTHNGCREQHRAATPYQWQCSLNSEVQGFHINVGVFTKKGLFDFAERLKSGDTGVCEQDVNAAKLPTNDFDQIGDVLEFAAWPRQARYRSSRL